MKVDVCNTPQNSDEPTRVAPLQLEGEKIADLRYGENPHQKASVYSHGLNEINLAGCKPLQGKELSYNNLLDADAAIFSLRCLVDGTDETGVVIMKHCTPCGAGRHPDNFQAWLKALLVDPVSVFGGIVATSQPIDAATANDMSKMFLEVIIAPGFSEGALELLAKKKNLRLLQIDNLMTAPLPVSQVRSIMGGYLYQEHDRPPMNVRGGIVVTKRQPTEIEWEQLDIAFRLCASMKSNAISLVRDHALAGFGSGQTSRVDAVKQAIEQALTTATPHKRLVMGSDAFFPFADGLESTVFVTAVVQPGGSKKDNEVIEVADKLGMAMVFTGERHFRH